MTLAYLKFETRHTYIHEIDFFYFYTLHYNNFFHIARTVKMSIFLRYNLCMCYRLSLLSTQSAQPLLRSDNLGSSQLSRVKIHGPSRATRELGARHYRVS